MTAYICGIIAGIAIALLVFFLKKPKWNSKYDERQQIGQGKAFKAGFLTLAIAEAIVAIWEYAAELPGVALYWHIGVIFLGITIYAVTAIHYDAYVGMNDTPKRFMQMGFVMFFAMLACAASNFVSDRPLNRDMAVLNLGLALVWAVILAALLIRNSRIKREDAE